MAVATLHFLFHSFGVVGNCNSFLPKFIFNRIIFNLKMRERESMCVISVEVLKLKSENQLIFKMNSFIHSFIVLRSYL